MKEKLAGVSETVSDKLSDVGDKLSGAFQIKDKLARFTGLSAKYILAANLRVGVVPGLDGQHVSVGTAIAGRFTRYDGQFGRHRIPLRLRAGAA